MSGSPCGHHGDTVDVSRQALIDTIDALIADDDDVAPHDAVPPLSSSHNGGDSHTSDCKLGKPQHAPKQQHAPRQQHGQRGKRLDRRQEPPQGCAEASLVDAQAKLDAAVKRERRRELELTRLRNELDSTRLELASERDTTYDLRAELSQHTLDSKRRLAECSEVEASLESRLQAAQHSLGEERRRSVKVVEEASRSRADLAAEEGQLLSEAAEREAELARLLAEERKQRLFAIELGERHRRSREEAEREVEVRAETPARAR